MKLSLVSATDSAADSELRSLDAAMARFYNGTVVADYYRAAHAANVTWAPDSFHQIVKRNCKPGMDIVDLGCGSAHAFANLLECGARYTGVDWSEERIALNQKQYRDGTFIASPLYEVRCPSESFDLSFSFYVLEHLVWPQRFLAEMVRLTRKGGLVIIECPHFRLVNRIPSLHYGFTVAPLSQKIRSGKFLDAIRHYWQRSVTYPRVVRSAYTRNRFTFLINQDPSCLSGTYNPDKDSVYFVDRDEVIAELVRLGCVDASKDLFKEWGRDIPADPCVVAARKI